MAGVIKMLSIFSMSTLVVGENGWSGEVGGLVEVGGMVRWDQGIVVVLKVVLNTYLSIK